MLSARAPADTPARVSVKKIFCRDGRMDGEGIVGRSAAAKVDWHCIRVVKNAAGDGGNVLIAHFEFLAPAACGEKRRRAAAVQDAGARFRGPRGRAASWTAPAPWRFGGAGGWRMEITLTLTVKLEPMKEITL